MSFSSLDPSVIGSIDDERRVTRVARCAEDTG